jgi:von Willebrand factor type A domain
MVKQKQAKVKGVGDIVFCIDATGSMQDCIDNVRDNIATFVTTLETSTPNAKIDWRARILAYRDFRKDANYLENSFDFVSSPSELKSQLNSIQASGGDDEPESTLDAILYASRTSKWRQGPCHKIVVVFTDATPLPHLDNKTQSELGIPDDPEVFAQVIQEDRLKLFLYGQKSPLYDEIARIPRTTVTQFDNAVEELKNGDFGSIMSSIGKTVSNLVSGGTVK